MKLLSLPQAPTRQQATFYCHSWIGAAVLQLGMMAFAGVMVYKYAVGKVPLLIMLLFVSTLLFFMLLPVGSLRRSFQSTNWLLAVGLDRLWIKYRSYLNSHFPPEDLQIVELLFSEIKSVCLVRQKEITYVGPGNKSRTQFAKYLEFILYEPFSPELPAALQAERNVKDNPDKKIRYRSLDYPLQTKGNNSFRVCMSGIRPGWKAVLRNLETNGITITPERRETLDYTLPLEDKKQMDDQLINLVEQGKTLAAVKLARRRYGMGLTDARQFVKELSGSA